jgi:DNA-binding CsgD family transcriptional regulator
VNVGAAVRQIGAAELSASLLSLYREAEHRPAPRHLDWALGKLGEVLPFDAALWIDGYLIKGRLHVYESLRTGPERSALRGHGHVRDVDPLLQRARERPGTAIALSLRGNASSTKFEAFAKRQRLRHGLALYSVDSHTSLASVIALYRTARKAQFRDEELEYLEAIAAHLVETRGIAAIQQLLRATHSTGTQLSASGVADRQAQLQVAPVDFQRLLRLEWPDWSERALPAPLARLVRERAGWRYVGERIVVKVSAMSDVYLLQPREKRPVDALSLREYEVARLMADGHTYKEAAQQLGIAPSTVRNHLRAIFATLGVKKQAEMAAALRESG